MVIRATLGCAYECGRKTFRWDNGPQGFGDDVKPGTTTQWPSTLNMAATFDWQTSGELLWAKSFGIKGQIYRKDPG